MAKGRVFLVDVRLLHPFALEVGTQDFVGGAGVYIIGSQQDPTLGCAAVFAHQIIDRGNGLLIWGGAGVENVFAQFFAFVLHRIEQ